MKYYGTAQRQHYTHVRVCVGLHACVGILTHHGWMCTCVHQVLHMRV